MIQNKYRKVSYIVLANLELIFFFFFDPAKAHCNVQQLVVKVLTSYWFSTYVYTICHTIYSTIYNTINNNINNIIPSSFLLICTRLFPTTYVTTLTSSKNVKKGNLFFLIENDHQVKLTIYQNNLKLFFILYEIINHCFGIVLHVLDKKNDFYIFTLQYHCLFP